MHSTHDFAAMPTLDHRAGNRRPGSNLWSAALLAVFCAFAGLSVRAEVQTSIRPEPGGKRLLFVDGNDIRTEPGGKRLLCVDDHTIRPEPTGKTLLYLDDDDVRDQFGGIRLALWDEHTLRRTPGGKALVYLDDNDIRTEAGGKRLFYIDGAKLSTGQLTAVLYQLKPELFQLSNDEKAALKKAMAAAGAESDAAAREDQLTGKYRIMTYAGEDGKKLAGSVTVSAQGKYYAVSFDAADAPGWRGIGVKHVLPDGTEELWAAVGPAAAVSLGIYEAKQGRLAGTWIPVNAADNPAALGRETLVGPVSGGGTYKIESGQLPNGGAAYTGAMNIEPLSAQVGSDGKAYRFKWATGTTGAAFSVGDTYAVCAGWGADYQLLRVRFYLGNLTGDFVGKSASGTCMLCK